MKTYLKFRPDLRACELEDRRVLAVSNVGAIVLTTGGYILVTPTLGVAAYPGGTPGGVAIPTAFVISGSGGISTLQPGISTGTPGLATTGTTGSSGGTAGTITVGSGANDASGLNIPVVTRNTIANDKLNPAPRIGSVFGDQSAPLPPGQVYRGGVPAAAPAGAATEAPRPQARWIPTERPVDASGIRLASGPHRLGADASANPVATIPGRVL